MLPAIVLAAEGFVVVWFAVFITMMMSMYLEARSLPLPRLDVAGRSLLASTKLAFSAGMIALTGLTIYELPMF